MRTRLGGGGFPRPPYGSFAGKEEAEIVVADISRGGIWPDKKRKYVEPVDWRRKSAEQRREFLENIILGLNDAPQDIQEEAAEVVKDFAPKRPTEAVQVAKKRLKDLSRSVDKIEQLAALHQQFIDEENDTAVLLMAAG